MVNFKKSIIETVDEELAERGWKIEKCGLQKLSLRWWRENGNGIDGIRMELIEYGGDKLKKTLLASAWYVRITR